MAILQMNANKTLNKQNKCYHNFAILFKKFKLATFFISYLSELRIKSEG